MNTYGSTKKSEQVHMMDGTRRSYLNTMNLIINWCWCSIIYRQ